MIFKTTKGYTGNGKAAFKLFKPSNTLSFWFSVEGNIPWDLFSAVKTAKLNRGSAQGWFRTALDVKYSGVIPHLMTWKKL